MEKQQFARFLRVTPRNEERPSFVRVSVQEGYEEENFGGRGVCFTRCCP